MTVGQNLRTNMLGLLLERGSVVVEVRSDCYRGRPFIWIKRSTKCDLQSKLLAVLSSVCDKRWGKSYWLVLSTKRSFRYYGNGDSDTWNLHNLRSREHKRYDKLCNTYYKSCMIIQTVPEYVHISGIYVEFIKNNMTPSYTFFQQPSPAPYGDIGRWITPLEIGFNCFKVFGGIQ